MIVKNAEDTIERCLASIRPHVDGIFVYDTGSTDKTLSLLKRLNEEKLVVEKETGQRVVEWQIDEWDAERWEELPLAPITVKQGEWRDDFAWAREQSYAMVPDDYDWVAWGDDDDIVEGAENFRALAAQCSPDCHGFVFLYDYARDDQGNCVCQLWRERLIRRSAGYEWREPVHEVLTPPNDQPAALAQVPPTMARWVHNRPAERYDPHRNLQILLAEKERWEAAEEPARPRILAYIGTELMAKGDFASAVPYLDAYTKSEDAKWSDERCQVRHKLATCLRVLGQLDAAVHCEFEAIKERDTWTENSIGLAGAFGQKGDFERAERWSRRALEQGLPNSPLILNPIEHRLLPWLTITDACLATDRLDEAREAVKQAQLVYPGPDMDAKAAEVERAANTAEIVGAVLMLREILVRHDENLKALHLLESVPYVIEDDSRIVQARAAQRKNVEHVLKPREYERWYRDEPKESTVGDEVVENVDQYIERAGYYLEGLREQEKELGHKPACLDLGSNDMWMSCFLWKKAAIVCDGVELNRQSVEKGHERLQTFANPAKLYHGDLRAALKLTPGQYDAVSLFEVLEHVPDVEETLGICESLVKPGGRVYLTTPNGAFERGMIDRWGVVELKGHVRAITANQLGDMLLERGKVEDMRIHAGGRLTFASYTPRPARSKIVLYAGAQWEPWSPESLREGGIGGSETALVQVATRLAARGHHVRVYSSAVEGLYGGALYRPFTAWDPTEEVDLLIVSRLAHVFDNPMVGAKQSALWCHDHSYPDVLTEERASKVDRIVVLSDWHRKRFAKLYPFTRRRLRVIRNGISLREIETGENRYSHASRKFSARRPRVIYSSSPDRGLEVLLDVWPRIREQAPKAELHVFYGFETIDRMSSSNPSLQMLKRSLLTKVAQLGGEKGGVYLRGRVGQVELADEMQRARVLAYPTAFLETSCITAMEARAAGLPIVTSDLGALRETVGEHGYTIAWARNEDKPCNHSPEYQDRFVRQVVGMMTDKALWTFWHQRALGTGEYGPAADENDWEHRVDDWEALLPRPKRSAKREEVAA